MKTTRYRLKDILIIKNGRDHSSLKDGSYPVIGSGGVMRFADQYLYNGESVLLPRKGTLNNIQYIKGAFWTVDTCYYTEINTDIAYPYYLYRHLRSLDLSGLDSGASIPSMTSKCYYGIKIDLPDLPTQKRIADILSTYDDLIENNNRRIALLEKVAQELYKEWFVRFRFPNHETAKFEKGIPEGWDVVKLGDYVEIKGGKRLPEGKTLYSDKTEHPYIRIRDITSAKFVSLNKNFEYIDNETFNIIHRFIVKSEDILISIVGTIGAIACVSRSLDGANFTENCVKLVNINHFTNSYLYHFLNSEMGKGVIQSGVVGATQPKLPLYNIKRIKLLKPQKELIDLFSIKIKTIDKQIVGLMEKNDNLTKQRDLLLPRLMSGELEV